MDKRIGGITPPTPATSAVSSAPVDAPAPTRVKRQPSPMREDIANRLDRLELQRSGSARLSGSSFRQPTVAKGDTPPGVKPLTITDLPTDMLQEIGKRLDLESARNARLTRKEMMLPLGGSAITKMTIPDPEKASLATLLTERLPNVSELSINDSPGDGARLGIAQLSSLEPAVAMRIKTLTLDGARINNRDLQHLKSLSNLTSLNIRNCNRIDDKGLAAIKGLTQLQSVSLQNCDRFSGAGFTHLQELPHLTSLDLQGCHKVNDAGLAALEKLPNLKSLNLQGCSGVTDAGLAHLETLPQLTSLNLMGCEQVTDGGLAHVKKIKQLATLDLSGVTRITDEGLANLTDAGPRNLERPQHLETLNLRFCNAITDAGLVHLAKLPQLKSLNLLYCYQLKDPGLEAVGGLKGLQELRLSGHDDMTDAGIANLQKLTNLTTLALDVNPISKTALASLAPLQQLHTLDLSGCKLLTNRELGGLAPLAQLKTLDLSGCQSISDAGLVHLSGLTLLENLHLPESSGISPQAVAQLKAALPLLK